LPKKKQPRIFADKRGLSFLIGVFGANPRLLKLNFMETVQKTLVAKSAKRLVASREILQAARKKKRAVAALNFYNAETLRAHINAANEANAPLMLQTTESTIEYLGIDLAVAMAQAAAKEIKQSVALHLDHGASFELAQRCVEAGYTSVMIDGSKLPFAENVDDAARRRNRARLRCFGRRRARSRGAEFGQQRHHAVFYAPGRCPKICRRNRS